MESAAARAHLRRLSSDAAVRVRRLTDLAATGVLWMMATSIILMLAAFIIYLFYLGFHALSWQFITGAPSQGAGGGIGPEIYNSFYILVLTLIFTVPLITATRLLPGSPLEKIVAPRLRVECLA